MVNPALVYGFEHTEFLQMDDDSVFICFTGIPGNYIYAYPCVVGCGDNKCRKD